MNNYLPMYICLGFIIISTILSFGFKDIYEVKIEKKGVVNTLKEYNQDLKDSFKFILKSGRMKAFILFQIVFYSAIRIIDTYRGDLLVNLGVPEEQFSMIFAILTLLGGLSIYLKKNIEKTFKNRTLTFISLAYMIACVIIGVIASIWSNNAIIPLVLILLTIQKISTAIWYILEYKYLKNFTTEDMRNKITFAYEFIGGIVVSFFTFLGGLLLNVVNIQNAFLIVGLICFVATILVLKYMKPRFGLRPKQYKKEDLEFETSK